MRMPESRAYKNTLIVVIAIAAAVLICAEAGAISNPSHMDGFVNTQGCAGCHRGRGISGTPLLKQINEALCFGCHGNILKKPGGKPGSKTDIESVLSKLSVHPVLQTAEYHRANEKLPSEKTNDERHVACADCHTVHLSNPENPVKGRPGYEPGAMRDRNLGGPPKGLRKNKADYEYELCYLCHADSANMPFDRRNVSMELDRQNASFHPVEGVGRNSEVPSLVRELSVTSRIACGDCHGNDDPMGPRGPHGSDYEPILVAQYRQEKGPEGPRAYDLCYSCHERRSILGDESFRAHKVHIVSMQISCASCHNAHGSRQYGNLVEFKELEAIGSLVSGGPIYISGASGRPQCYLRCHDVEHDSSGAAGRPWPW